MTQERIPELRESEDERIRKELIEAFEAYDVESSWNLIPVKHILAWLKKQKEQKPETLTEGTKEYTIREDYTSAYYEQKGYAKGYADGKRDAEAQKTDAKSERVIKAARSVLNNWLDGTDCPDVSGDFTELEYAIREYDGEEKQKEQDKCPEYCVRSHCLGCPIYEKREEQKPNIELIQSSWYREGYNDREFGKEPKWIVKTGESGPRHELNPRYGQPLAEQKPVENEKVEMTDFEQSVYNLCPVLGIEEAKATASDLLELAKKTLLKTGKVVLASNYPEGCSFEDGFHLGYNEGFNAKQKEQKCAEWNEEDECKLNQCIRIVSGWEADYDIVKSPYSNFLKSIRPSWKPSEEQPEVDLEKEIKSWILNECGPSDFSPFADHWCADDIMATARHFYELGKISLK